MNVREEAAQLRELCQRHYESGNLPQAMDLIQECLAIDSDDARTLELNGLIQYSAGRYQDSVDSLESASMAVPLRLAAQVCLAHGYGKLGKLQLSSDLLTELLDTADIPVPLLLQVGTGLDQADRPDLAIRACRQAADKKPNYAQTWYDMGYYIGRCGGPDDEVEQLARKAVELAPDCIRYRVGLAGLLIRNDRSKEAHEFISDFSNDDIRSITCTCCLRRVISVYEQAHDYRRVVVGREHLVLIENSRSSHGPC